jgi:hypothetical protein
MTANYGADPALSSIAAIWLGSIAPQHLFLILISVGSRKNAAKVLQSLEPS